jgi:poly(3-hydroxyalkanoate) synthetase
LFKENRLAKGEFIGLGRRLNLKDIICPTYLLAGESDDITTREQVLDAGKYLGTPPGKIEKKLVPGGHIGLFMGSRNLRGMAGDRRVDRRAAVIVTACPAFGAPGSNLALDDPPRDLDLD